MLKSQEQSNFYSKDEAQKEAAEMIEKIKSGEAKDYPEAEKIVGKEKVSFNEMIEEIISSGKLEYEICYWNDNESNYPENVVERLKSISKEEIIAAVKKAEFFLVSNIQVIKWIDKEGKERENYSFGGPKETAIGTERSAFPHIVDEKDYIIRANVQLLHINGEEPKIKVILLASNPNGIYNGHMGYPCVACCGNGCWICDFSGGNG